MVILATGRAMTVALESVTLRAAPIELFCLSSGAGLAAEAVGCIVDERAKGA